MGYDQKTAGREVERALILPINEKLPTSGLTPAEGDDQPPGETEWLETGLLQRESEAKPFFTQVLDPGSNRQHKRLVAIVPLLLLAVILLFIFAYIAAK